MNRRHSLRVALAALLLAGCDGGAGEDGTAAKALHFTDCEEQTALLVVAPAQLPPLPEGFAYGKPLPGLPLAGVHVSGSRCADLDGRGPTQDLLAFALIEPPESYRSEGVTAYGILLGGYTRHASTAAAFAAWGMGDKVQAGTVDWQLTATPVARIGSVSASGASSSVTTRINGLGPVIQPGGGLTRAFHFAEGRVAASIDAFYTPQTGMLGIGTAQQQGDGPLPLGYSVATGSHAWDYDLELRNPQRYP
ncbi:hypothetical protein D0B54_14415 [Solimonas sp. K1W22B-7]|uniref:hypothetical protein n=1 Tax=Solimonas sp. K1W22B-7 TaxID=2303331 RepID=UPI000E331F3D|nr:hypothetical protein [Solimonas sp. K1W22B-7]AXQ29794.1 hypothetical protein D0B54_14415 [Solimonas sp. K1W22B-7]